MAAAEILRRLDHGIFTVRLSVYQTPARAISNQVQSSAVMFFAYQRIFPLEHAVFQVDIADLL